ncbi:MAG: SUMF1/EgtB/PvdO family nonheme iron enzyme [bacterium]|nr:SUMF1/EgtB/PvdO family nonheme iron enzyme [bacterium]
MKRTILFGMLVSLVGFWFLLQSSTNLHTTFNEQLTQTAPQGMVLVQSDTLLPYYISVTEESNIHYKTYILWLKNVFQSYPEVYKQAYPKDTVGGLWLQYNDPMIQDYNNHPAFMWYPVTGVTWFQVKSYLEWKTDRLNEMILDKTEIINIDMSKTTDDHNFNTESYLNEVYLPEKGNNFNNFIKGREQKSKEYVKVEDGILFPQYRLPTEAEWNLAASYTNDLQNSKTITNSLNQSDFLDKWMLYYQLVNSYKTKQSSNFEKIGFNFYSGVSEWLLDLENYRQGTGIAEYDVLLINGWYSFMYSNPLDQYG